MNRTEALPIALTAMALAVLTEALAESVLPVPNPLYWLDVSDKNSLTFDPDTGELLTLSDKSGNGYHFARSLTHYSGGGGYRGPAYTSKPDSNSPPSHLPYAFFAPLTNDLVQATAAVTSPRTVFIVQKTVAGAGNGGIWGRWGQDRGIRLIGLNGPSNTWQWVYDAFTFFKTCDFIISYQVDDAYWTDNELFDSRQTWFNTGWGVTTGYGNHDYGQTSMGFYYENRWWSGGIGEVIVYGSYLSDGERQAVEAYLTKKWLQSDLGTLLIVR